MIQGDAQRAMVDAIRHAFAAGDSAAGESLLATALEADVPWDLATRAVAEGVARRYGSPRRSPPKLARA